MYLRMTPWWLGCIPLPLPADLLSPGRYYAAGLAISFGVGMMMGAFWSGGWGWGCGWGNNNININNNNNFNRNSNIGANRNNIGGGNRPSQQPGRVALVQAAETPVGGTIRNIAAGAISRPCDRRQVCGAARGDSLATVRLVPGNSLAVKAAIWQAIGRRRTARQPGWRRTGHR